MATTVCRGEARTLRWANVRPNGNVQSLSQKCPYAVAHCLGTQWWIVHHFYCRLAWNRNPFPWTSPLRAVKLDSRRLQSGDSRDCPVTALTLWSLSIQLFVCGCGSVQTPQSRPRIIGLTCSVSRCPGQEFAKEMPMNRIIYIVGFVVIVIFILGFLGLR